MEEEEKEQKELKDSVITTGKIEQVNRPPPRFKIGLGDPNFVRDSSLVRQWMS
jgi:hypothetical protein